MKSWRDERTSASVPPPLLPPEPPPPDTSITVLNSVSPCTARRHEISMCNRLHVCKSMPSWNSKFQQGSPQQCFVWRLYPAHAGMKQNQNGMQ